MKMKKKIMIGIAVVIVLVLFVPIPMRLKDGGSVRYKAMLYEVTKYHQLDSEFESGYKDGWGLEVLGMKIFTHME